MRDFHTVTLYERDAIFAAAKLKGKDEAIDVICDIARIELVGAEAREEVATLWMSAFTAWVEYAKAHTRYLPQDELTLWEVIQVEERVVLNRAEEHQIENRDAAMVAFLKDQEAL